MLAAESARCGDLTDATSAIRYASALAPRVTPGSLDDMIDAAIHHLMIGSYKGRIGSAPRYST